MTKNCNKIAFLTDHSLLFLFSIHTPSLSEIVTVEWLIWLWNAMKAYTTNLKHFLSTQSFQNNFYSAHKNYTKMCTQCKASSVKLVCPITFWINGENREMLIVPNKWHAVIMYTIYVRSIQPQSCDYTRIKLPPFPEEYIFKTILSMGGTECKTKQKKLFNSHITSYHVSPWPFYSPSHANTHKWGRKGVYDGLQ